MVGVGFLEDLLLVIGDSLWRSCSSSEALVVPFFFAMLRLDARRGPGPKKQKFSLFPGLLFFGGSHLEYKPYPLND